MSNIAPAAWPYNHLPSVDDLKVRKCFICMDEDVSDAGVRRTRAQHGFVHACRCTLVAHERCLLSWIDSGDEARRQCAQCKEPYIVLRDTRSSPLALRVLNVGNNGISIVGKKINRIFIGSTLVATTYSICTLYGLYVARCTLGGQVFNRFLRHPSQWSYSTWFLLPTIPTTLFVENLSPGVVPLIWSGIGMTTFWMGAVSSLFAMGQTPVSWPPSPRIIVSAVPVVISAYGLGIQWLDGKLLGDTPQVYTRRLRGDPIAGGAAPAEQALNLGILDPGAGAQGQNEDRDKIERIIGRGWVSMLLMPPLAGGIGNLLCRAAEYSGSEGFRSFLGMNMLRTVHPIVNARSLLDTFGRAMKLDIPYEPPPLAWFDFEPIWWQSLIGLVLVTVGKDALALAYKLLMLHDDERRTIVDLPFDSVDIQALELVS